MSKGNQAVIPSISVDGGASALEFYKRAFGATERYRLEEPGGKIAHAEIELCGGLIMLADEYPDLGFVGPKKLTGSASRLTVYVPDVDAFAARAVEAGATVDRPLRDEFYGDRAVTLRDPFGHLWSIHTRKEDLSDEDIKQRYAKLMAGG